jgi:type IV secretion system protein VirB10
MQKASKSDKEEMEAEKRAAMRETALTAVTRVATFDSLAEKSQKSAAGVDIPQSTVNMPGTLRPTAGPGSGAQGAAVDNDPNMQARKDAFAAMEKSTGYLGALKQAPISKYELKAGTIMPAVMISGINSDIPGEIVAQVSQNVYDSATGNYLLIPQGAKLVGVYDSHVAVGQERVQVGWTRLNFPDSSTLDLGNMPGSDQAGYGGYHDKVNNHFLRIFGDALMLSVLSAGAQLSQPQSASANGVPTTGQTVTAAMGQQFASTGGEITKRNMLIQPTLEIRPGYQFNVMVSKDIILEPYVEKE